MSWAEIALEQGAARTEMGDAGDKEVKATEVSNLLLVEDDTLLSGLVSRAFSRRGYAVQVVRTCADALALDASFDAGIFDVSLTDGDGLTLAAKLLSRGTVRSAVFFSGDPDPTMQRQAETIAPFVEKQGPFSELERVIAEQIARSRR